jgi:hypothetical protein
MKTARLLFSLSALFICALIPGLTQARDASSHWNESVDAKGVKRIEAEIKYGAGRVTVAPLAMSDAARFDVTSGGSTKDYDLEYVTHGDVGELLYENKTKHLKNIDTDQNHLEVTLSENYPTDLSLEVGACEADVDLGGLRLTQLKIDVGASSGDIQFSKPNPERMRDMKISAGAASVNLVSLGNANFEHFKFDGGVGKFRIDLRGEYHGESEIVMSIGLGSATIILPEGIPVQIHADRDNWLSSVDLHSHKLEEVGENEYQSPGFDTAKTRIILRLDVGLGSADVRWR